MKTSVLIRLWEEPSPSLTVLHLMIARFFPSPASSSINVESHFSSPPHPPVPWSHRMSSRGTETTEQWWEKHPGGRFSTRMCVDNVTVHGVTAACLNQGGKWGQLWPTAPTNCLQTHHGSTLQGHSRAVEGVALRGSRSRSLSLLFLKVSAGLGEGLHVPRSHLGGRDSRPRKSPRVCVQESQTFKSGSS